MPVMLLLSITIVLCSTINKESDKNTEVQHDLNTNHEHNERMIPIYRPFYSMYNYIFPSTKKKQEAKYNELQEFFMGPYRESIIQAKRIATENNIGRTASTNIGHFDSLLSTQIKDDKIHSGESKNVRVKTKNDLDDKNVKDYNKISS